MHGVFSAPNRRHLQVSLSNRLILGHSQLPRCQEPTGKRPTHHMNE
jgi:hypothetical protein